MTPQETVGALRLVRVVDAPPAEVFAAWTEPDRVCDWFGPPDGTAESADLDLKVGGEYRIHLGPVSAVGRYVEIEPPRLLVFTFGWDPVPDALFDVGETLVRVEFGECGEGTELRMLHERLPTEATSSFHRMGWGLCLDRLAGVVG